MLTRYCVVKNVSEFEPNHNQKARTISSRNVIIKLEFRAPKNC